MSYREQSSDYQARLTHLHQSQVMKQWLIVHLLYVDILDIHPLEPELTPDIPLDIACCKIYFLCLMLTYMVNLVQEARKVHAPCMM